jgi:general L-amino acid transport system permease protein
MSVRPNARPAGHKPPFWRDRAKRALIFQCLLIAAVIVFLFYIVGNVQDNLSSRGITTGFGFLNNTAGFGIVQSLIDYSSQSTYGRTFFVGLLNTLLVGGLGVIARHHHWFYCRYRSSIAQLADRQASRRVYRNLS